MFLKITAQEIIVDILINSSKYYDDFNLNHIIYKYGTHNKNAAIAKDITWSIIETLKEYSLLDFSAYDGIGSPSAEDYSECVDTVFDACEEAILSHGNIFLQDAKSPFYNVDILIKEANDAAVKIIHSSNERIIND